MAIAYRTSWWSQDCEALVWINHLLRSLGCTGIYWWLSCFGHFNIDFGLLWADKKGRPPAFLSFNFWCPYYCLSNKTKAKSSAFQCRGSTRIIINNYHLVYSSIAYNGRTNPNATPLLLVKLALYALTCWRTCENHNLCYECVVAHIYYISPCLFQRPGEFCRYSQITT